MPAERLEHQPGEPIRQPGERLEHEVGLTDPRPRERKRDRATFGLIFLGAVGGAGIFALGVWIAAMLVDQHYSPFVYLLVGAIGAAVVPGILPYLSLARADGADAEVVRERGRRGRADAPVEGAQSVDTESSDQPGA